MIYGPYVTTHLVTFFFLGMGTPWRSSHLFGMRLYVYISDSIHNYLRSPFFRLTFRSFTIHQKKMYPPVPSGETSLQQTCFQSHFTPPSVGTPLDTFFQGLSAMSFTFQEFCVQEFYVCSGILCGTTAPSSYRSFGTPTSSHLLFFSLPFLQFPLVSGLVLPKPSGTILEVLFTI